MGPLNKFLFWLHINIWLIKIFFRIFIKYFTPLTSLVSPGRIQLPPLYALCPIETEITYTVYLVFLDSSNTINHTWSSAWHKVVLGHVNTTTSGKDRPTCYWPVSSEKRSMFITKESLSRDTGQSWMLVIMWRWMLWVATLSL